MTIKLIDRKAGSYSDETGAVTLSEVLVAEAANLFDYEDMYALQRVVMKAVLYQMVEIVKKKMPYNGTISWMDRSIGHDKVYFVFQDDNLELDCSITNYHRGFQFAFDCSHIRSITTTEGHVMQIKDITATMDSLTEIAQAVFDVFKANKKGGQ